MFVKKELLNFVSQCKTKLDVSSLTQEEEYGYHNLPLCIIDAIFSIGVNYTSTSFGNTVKRFCDYLASPGYMKMNWLLLNEAWFIHTKSD